MKVEIIRICNGDDDGGVRTSELMFVPELKKRGYSVNGIILGKGQSTEIYKSLFDHYTVLKNPPKFNGSITRKILNIVPIMTYALTESKKWMQNSATKEHEYRVTTRQQPTLLFAAMLARRLNTQVYWHTPGAFQGPLQKIFFSAAKSVNKIITLPNSLYTAHQLGEGFNNIVYPGYSEGRLPLYCSRTQSKSAHPTYLCLSRICYEKASDILVDSFLKSIPFKKGAHLILAGSSHDASFRHQVEKVAQEQGDGRIQILPFQENIDHLMMSADIIVNGRRDAEPFGISIVEAMGAGKPVLSYYLGGPSETIDDGKTGWLIKAPSIEAYTQGFNRTWKDRSSWSQFGFSAHQQAQKFKTSAQVDIYLEKLGLSSHKI